MTQVGADSIVSQSPKMTGKGQGLMCRNAGGKCYDALRCLHDFRGEAH